MGVVSGCGEQEVGVLLRRYCITSNLSDVSNYSDSVMNYFLPPIQSYKSITLNISCSNYTDSSLTHDHDHSI